MLRFNFRPAFIATTITAALFASNFAFAGEKLSVHESTQLPASADAVWQLTGDFGGVDKWVPGLSKVEIIDGKDNQKGAIRAITTAGGAYITEQLVEYSKAKRKLRYKVLGGPLPVKHYVSTFTVKPKGSGSEIDWSSTFEQSPTSGLDAAKTREVIQGIYLGGFKALHEKFPDKK